MGGSGRLRPYGGDVGLSFRQRKPMMSSYYDLPRFWLVRQTYGKWRFDLTRAVEVGFDIEYGGASFVIRDAVRFLLESKSCR